MMTIGRSREQPRLIKTSRSYIQYQSAALLVHPICWKISLSGRSHEKWDDWTFDQRID